MAKSEVKAQPEVSGDNNANLSEIERLSFETRKDDALIKDNQELAKAESPVKSAEQEVPEVKDWEQSAKYFQSEKDKVSAENTKIKNDLEKYKALGQFVENRPDVQQYLKSALAGNSPPPPTEAEAVPQGPPEDFDPWEAYNDPNSSSFQYRQEMEKGNITKAVQQSQQELVSRMALDSKMKQFDTELSDLGLDPAQKKQFYEFANKPLTDMGTDVLVKMWKAADDKVNTPQNASTPPPEIAVVQRNQSAPAPVGVLQGESPPAVNETDDLWERVMNASNRSRVI